MTKDEEIERIKQDFKAGWPMIEQNPQIQKALREKNVVELGELAQKLICGNNWKPTPQEIAEGQENYEHHLMYKKRERLIEEKGGKPN